MDYIYQGTLAHNAYGGRIVLCPDGTELPLYTSEVNHSPDGFMWGYCGSGPHQLSYALLRHAIGQETAKYLYKEFCLEVISKLDKDSTWQISRQRLFDIIPHLTPC